VLVEPVGVSEVGRDFGEFSAEEVEEDEDRDGREMVFKGAAGEVRGSFPEFC